MKEDKGFEIALEIANIKKENFKNYKNIAKRIKEILKDLINDNSLRVIVFGSVVRGNYNILSDIDILVITEKADKINYGEIVDKLYEKLGKSFIGVELHIVTPEKFENWYKKFLDVYEEIN